MATASEHQGPQGPVRHQDRTRSSATPRTKGPQLERAVGVLDLTALGLGAIIGTGIFVVLGEAIGDSGPAIILSFLLAGVTCAFSALAFAELASSIPVSGSAYTYSYATMGELAAWIIGWDLILEYAVSVAAVAVGWGQYFNDLMDSLFGFQLPDSLADPPGEGGSFNLPAVFLVLAVTARALPRRARDRAREHGHGRHQARHPGAVPRARRHGVQLGNLSPFAPNGFDGVVTAASVVFFAYIGFDAISTSGEETMRPGRDLPIAIIGSLAVATLLYILVSLIASAALPYDQIAGAGGSAGRGSAGAGFDWGATVISFGALIAITSVVLTILYGQTRIMFAMCRDGLMPRGFAKVSERPPRRCGSPPRSGS